MDEDYDACDLENWFLAIQSADGQVVIPSFHRPGILTAGRSGPSTTATASSDAKILRPRAVDGHSALSFPDLVPDATTGKITYDVDNDGDGVKDAVWLDLGYPASRNAAGRVAEAALRLHRHRAQRPAAAEHRGQPPAACRRRHPALRPTRAHLGNSPSEIDPTYALQNAPDTTGTSTRRATTSWRRRPASPSCATC